MIFILILSKIVINIFRIPTEMKLEVLGDCFMTIVKKLQTRVFHSGMISLKILAVIFLNPIFLNCRKKKVNRLF